MPGTPETILAFDFGLRRIGAAVGQHITRSATPLGAIRNGSSIGNTGPDWVSIEKLVLEWQPARLIVGLPLHADGTQSAISEAVSQFIAELARFGCPIETVDERYSSLEAKALLRDARAGGRSGRIRKETIDSAAAALIAERWLQGH